MKCLSVLFFVGICVTLSAPSASAQIFAVGNCKPHLVSYSTISEAVAAVPPNSTVLVCAGTYPEQVTIAQPLILKGPDNATGIKTVTVQSISAQATDDSGFGPVDISNLIVNGDGTTSGGCGISYVFASGTINNVEVSGCGISLVGSSFVVDTVDIRNSNIHDFGGTGILATSNGATGFIVNVNTSWISSTSTSVQAGIDYEFTDGLAAHNTIDLAGGVGLFLNNFFDGMTVKENTIIGASVGIYSGGNLPFTPTLIAHNNLFDNGTGIFIGGTAGYSVVESNVIVQSSTAAVDLHCNQQTKTEHNTISSAPIGIANLSSVDTVRGNTLYNVPTSTTACP